MTRTDKERFREMHSRVYPDLLRFVERRVPPSEAEDIVSTVFLTAWRRFGEVPEDARPWLFAVARKTMANQVRGWLRRRALDVRLATEDSPMAGDHAGAAALRVDLQRAWRAQRPADREALALVLFDGLTVDQAAEVLGCRPQAFAMRLSRARQRLLTAVRSETPATIQAPLYPALKGQQS